MGHTNCCVKNCKNTGYNSDCVFYRFPMATHKLVQRQKWIDAVRKKAYHESNWLPKRHQVICSGHFIGGKKSDTQISPSYVPTLFSSNTATSKDMESNNRHNRFMKRRSRTKDATKKSNLTIDNRITQKEGLAMENLVDNTDINLLVSVDEACQVIIREEDDLPKPLEETFVYIKNVHLDYVDVEVQTDIKKKFKDKSCNTSHKIHANVAVGSDEPMIKQ